MTPSDATGPGDPLDPVIADYLQQVEAGKAPDRNALLADHPALADRLREFFADLDRVGRRADAFRLPDPESTVGDMGDAAAGPDLPRVRYLGDYELLAEIARGGMGVVYEARQVSLNRTVALKMILAGTYASAAAVQRFRDEAEAAAGLDHPNILPIYEVGEHDGHQYFSMKLVPGGHLGDTIGALTDRPRDTAGLLETLARAVHFAHQRGILHRDLKPANVLTGKDGTLYVSDFGLAKKVGGDDGSTRTGTVVGTPAYMAPEQARGAKGLSVAADVYSLGAILYEAIAGRPPFRGDTVLDTLRQVTDSEPAHPQSIHPGADRDLSIIALKCLEKDPAKRYPSAEALADDLRRWSGGEPIEARPAGAIERARKWARRNPAAAAVVLMAAALGVGIVSMLVLALQMTASAVQSGAHAQQARNDAVEQKQTAEARLWDATFEQARAERLSGNRWKALELVAEAAGSKATPELAREAAQAVTAFGLRLVSKTPGRGYSFGRGDSPALAFSADGALFVVPNNFRPEGADAATSATGLTIHETASGRILAGVACEPDGFACHPSRPLLAVGRAGRVILRDLTTGTETDLGVGAGPFAFDPTGRSLAAGGAAVVVYDLTGGPPRRLAVVGKPLGFTRDGVLVRTRADNRLHHWDVARDRAISSTPEGWGLTAVGPDGRRAVLRDRAGAYFVWDMAAGRVEHALPKLNAPPYLSTTPFDPAGSLLAYESEAKPRTVELLDLDAGRVRERLLVPGRGPRAILQGYFRPDGSVLAVEDEYRGDVTLWEVGTGTLLATLPEHSKAHWSPDGRHLAAFCATGWVDHPGGGRSKGTDSHVRVYEVAHVPGRARLDRPVDRLSFSADGKTLAAADTLWALDRTAGRPRLRWAGRVPDGRTTFFDPAGRRWTFAFGALAKPDTPFTLVRADPEPTTVSFPGRPDHGWAGNPMAGRIDDLAVHPAGRTAVLGFDGYQKPAPGDTSRTGLSRLEYWDLVGPELLGVWQEGGGGHEFRSPVFSPDGRRAATAGNYLGLFDVASGKQLSPKYSDARSSPRVLAFTPDGRRLAVGYDGGWVALVDPETGKGVERQAHDGDMSAVAVSPDGRYVAAAGEDRTVSVWDAGTMTRLAQWTIGAANPTALAFAPDARALAVGDEKGLVQVWDLAAILDDLARLGLGAK